MSAASSRSTLALLVLALLVPTMPPAAATSLEEVLDVEPAGLPLADVVRTQAPSGRGQAEGWVLPGRVVVGFEGDAALSTPALAVAAASVGGRVLRVDTVLDFAVVAVPPAETERLVKEAARLPGVRYAVPDARAQTFFTPDDPLYPGQWGPGAIGMETAWNTTRGGHDRTVAVLDTGVNASHPDLAANVCVLGPDYPNGDADPSDDQGHGTHVAGTVAAAIHNGVGVAGMSNACLMPVKVLDAWGSGSFADVASGIVWATDNGAHVISMSLGGCPGCDPGAPLSDAVAYADAAGVFIVAAAGNFGCAPVAYPAAYPEVVAVAALSPPGNVTASFSDCGAEVELSAPGVGILSTALPSGPLSDPSGYMNLSGTSMATPHVAGVAALVWSAVPNLTASDLRCLLAQTADDVMASGRDVNSGHGRVDAAAAIAQGACTPQIPDAPTLDVSLAQDHPETPSPDPAHSDRLLGGETFLLPLDADDVDVPAVGMTRDAGPHARHATVTGAVPTGGRFGGAYLFNGTNQSISIPATGAMPEGTVMFWARNDDPESSRAFFKQAPGVWNDLSVHVSDRVMFNTDQESVVVETAPGSVVTGQWTHVAVTWGPAGKRVYVDGALAAQANDTTGVGDTHSVTMLGNSPNDIETGGFVGALDDVREYGVALDAATIQDVMAAPYQAGTTTFAAHLAWSQPASFGSNVTAFRVYSGTDGAPLSLLSEVPAPSSGTTVGPLEENVTYTFAVSAVNGLGEGPRSAERQVTPLAPRTLPYADDFETGAPGWSATGLWHLGPDRVASGNASYYYGIENGPGLDDNTYDTGVTNSGALTSPPLDLTGTTHPVVRFWHHWESEGGSYERPILQVSTDGHQGPWASVHERASTTGEAIDTAYLGAYAGSVVHVRFFWDTRDPVYNDYEGWYVDDVAVFESDGPPSCDGTSDMFGNVCSDVPYAFEDVQTTGTPIPLSDDALSAEIPLPFPFRFYGATHDSLVVSSNGFLTFTENGFTGCCDGDHIPSPQGPNDLVAAYWTDLLPVDADDVVHATLGEPGNRSFVVQFTDVPFCCNGNASGVTFQVKLLEGSDAIEVHYLDANASGTGRVVSAGIERCDGGDGILMGRGGLVLHQVAVRYDAGNGVAPCPLNTPPNATIVSPVDGDVLSGTVPVQGVAADADGDPIVDVLLMVDGWGYAYAGVNASGNWSTLLNTTAFANGLHSLSARAYDGETWGPIHEILVTFNNTPAQNTAPVATITSPQHGESVNGSIAVTGLAKDADEGDAIEAVDLRVGNVSYLVTGLSAWTAMVDTTALANGFHVLSAYAYDGEAWGEPDIRFVYVNNTAPYAPPTVDILAPAPGETVSGTVRVQGVAAASAGHEVALVQIRIDGGAWTDAAGAETWAGYWSTEGLAGAHLIEARSFDGTSFSAIDAVTVDVHNDARPTVAILSPAHGETVSGILLVQGIAGDDVDVASVEVSVDGGPWRPAQGTTTWSRYVDTRHLSEGLHDIEARSSDGHNLSLVALAQVIVANDRAPTVAIDSPVMDQVVGGRIVVQGRASDLDGTVHQVEVRVGHGGNWTPATGTASWSATLDLRSLGVDAWVPILARSHDGVAYGDTALVYVHVRNLADIAVGNEDIEVLRQPFRTDVGDAPNLVNERRVIRITVHNEGFVASTPQPIIVFARTPGFLGQPSTATERTLNISAIPSIPAGGSTTIEVPWDTTRYVGDVTIEARLLPCCGADLRSDNNVAAHRTFVRIGGAGGTLL